MLPLRARCFVLVTLLAACQASKPAPPPERTPPPVPEWQKLVDAWEHPAPIPSFELTDQDGRRFRLGDLGDGYLLMSFAFSTCQVVKACPTTMRKMREVQDLWLEQREQGKTGGKTLRILTCTIDPENDTPKILREYGALNGADFAIWRLATGPEGLMRQGLPSLLGVMAMRDGRGTLEHGVKAALLAPGLRPIREWDDNEFEAEAVLRAVLEHGADAGVADGG